MDKKIIIWCKDLYKEVPLLGAYGQKFCVGTKEDMCLRFRKENFEVDFCIYLNNEDNQWIIQCSKTILLESQDGEYSSKRSFHVGDRLKVVNALNKQELFSVYLTVYFKETVDDYNKRIDCRNINTFSIGASLNNTIHILKLIANNAEIVLTKRDNSYEGIIKNAFLSVSINGCEVSQNRIMINNHDFLSLDGYSFYFCDGWLYFSEKLPISTGMFLEVVHTAKNHMVYPAFVRSVRQMYEMPSEKIEVLPPKSFSQNANRSLVMTIVPVLVSMMFMVVMRFFMGRSAVFAIYSAGMMLVSIVMAVWNYKHQGKQYIESIKNRTERYSQYISGSEQRIRKLRDKEQRIARQKCPSLEEQLSYVMDFDARLFERRPEDDDFLSCYLGIGKLQAENQVNYKKQEYVDVDDPLMDYPEMLHDKYRYSDNMPVALKLKENSAVGVIGNRNKLYQMLKNMMLTLSVSHYFNDVKFCLFIDKEDIPYFKWCRWLQNLDNNFTRKRNIACDEKSSRQLLEFLYAELSERESVNNSKNKFGVHYIIFVYRSNITCKHPINKFFAKAKELGFTFIFFEEYPEFVNKDCETRVFLSNDTYSGYIQKAKDGEDIQYFSYPHISMKDVEKAALTMSCIYVEETNLESKLTKNISLFELLQISSVTQLDLESRWNNSKIYESMAAPLGVKSGDEVVYLDLHEKFHGPHGLVAGTTGSGKSEILQSYILSMATLFHPYEIGFIIIDFKGGGMANQFRDLPHLNGAITNIDGKQIERSLMSIRAELLKRQQLFAEYDVNHIDDYIRLYKNGKTQKPLPHLILIVDEFAELKSEQPEFMKELISTARIGRSLGVHLILATQKPAGVVNDQIWSNSNFKLCLRVQNKEDSNEVLKSPLAAEIREPGRAYLQVGNNEIFLLFQSGYSGATLPSDDIRNMKDFKINIVDICGNRMPIYEQKKPKGDSQITQLEAMVEYVASYCKDNKINKLPDICLPPLESNIPYSVTGYRKETEDICVPYGYYDNPSRQLQELTEINFTQNNIVIVGSSQSGKTNLLQVIIRAIAELYTPESANIFILDFASMALKRFEKLVHVGGVITLREDDTMKSFMKMIMEELDRRKDKLSEKGYSSFSVYRESGETDMPQIILMLDNMAAFRELFPQYEDAFLRLCREGVAVGISVVVTSTQSNAMGFRMLSNFGKRIALYANDSSVYGHLFDRCKIKPDNMPGRFLTEIDKEVYEGQCFVAFNSEKESNKMMEIDKFVAEINQKFKDNKVIKFEGLPEVVTSRYIRERTKCLPGQIAVGIDYLSVQVRTINILEDNIWGILEKEHSGSTNFMKYVIQSVLEQREEQPVQIRIVDHINKKLDVWGEHQDIVQYTYNPAQIIEYVAEMEEILEERYQNMINGKSDNEKQELLVLLINSSEAYNILGANYKAQEMYTRIVSQYRGLGVFIILGKLPNASMNFGMSPIIKASRDGMNIFIFQNITEQRLVDVSSAVAREYAKNLETGDAYLIIGTELNKVKTPLLEKE